MIKKIAIGFVGGMLYIGMTWAATLTGVLDWYQNFDAQNAQEIISIFAPFSLMAVFLFASMLAYNQWYAPNQEERRLPKLMIIGAGFAIGATAAQLLLMTIDGLPIQNSAIIAGVFFISSLIIALLIATFYCFLRA